MVVRLSRFYFVISYYETELSYIRFGISLIDIRFSLSKLQTALLLSNINS